MNVARSSDISFTCYWYSKWLVPSSCIITACWEFRKRTNAAE